MADTTGGGDYVAANPDGSTNPHQPPPSNNQGGQSLKETLLLTDSDPDVCGGGPEGHEDWKYWLACFFCCIGGLTFAAWIMHWVARAAEEAGDHQLAEKLHPRAKKFWLWGIILGLVVWIIYIIIVASTG